MIAITQRADEASRSPDRRCYYVASAEVDGIAYAARARYGAANDIARQLVAAGIPDQSVIARTMPQGWELGYHSLYRLATRTVSEGPTRPLHEHRWIDPAVAFSRHARVSTKGHFRGGFGSRRVIAPDARNHPYFGAYRTMNSNRVAPAPPAVNPHVARLLPAYHGPIADDPPATEAFERLRPRSIPEAVRGGWVNANLSQS